MSNQKLVLVEEITELTAKNLSGTEKENKIAQLSNLESEIVSGLSNSEKLIHNMMFSSQKDIFTYWASTLKQLHFLGEFEKPINTISVYIQKQIGKMTLGDNSETDLDKKENMCRNVQRSFDTEFKEDYSNRQIVGDNTFELNEEQKFLLETFESLEKFYGWMENIAKTMKEHMKDSNMNADMLKYFDKYHKIASLREPIEFMMGEGSILNQIDDEQNIRESATILQKAIAVSMGNILSYRQMAHGFSVVPRQNQRIRNRLAHWPKKDIETVIRKNILSYCCQECGMNIITGKKYNKNGEITGEVKLSHKSYPIPKQYLGQPLSPIQIAIEVSKK